MRLSILVSALAIIVVGVIGLIAPDGVIAFRRSYVVTPLGPYLVASIRVGLGSLLIMFAPRSRAPSMLRVLGAVVCAQGLIQAVGMPFVGFERGRAIFEWEADHPMLLRAGAAIAVAFGGFTVFGVTNARR